MNVEVVTASKHLQRISEAPGIIRVVTAAQIRQRGYESVGEALKAVPGLYIIDDHLSYSLGVRGINGGMRGWSRIAKVMINSQPVSYRSSAANWLGAELIPIRAVERIEVFVGPASALYGANAYLGVVNIITKDGDDLRGSFLSGHAGDENGNLSYGGDLVAGGRAEGVTFLLAAQATRSDRSGLRLPETSPDLPDYHGQRSANDIARPKSFFGSLQYRSSFLGAMALTGNLQCLDRFGEYQDWGILTHENRVSLRNWFVKAEQEKDLGSRLSMKTSLAYAEGGPTDDDHLDIGSSLYWKKRDTGYRAIDLAAETRYRCGPRFDLTIGTDYTRDKQNLQSVYSVFKHDFGARKEGDVVLDGTALADTVFNNLGIYGQGIYHATRGIGLTAGLRYDDHNIYGDMVSSRGAIVYRLLDDRYCKLLYGTSFRAPAPVQLFTKPLKSGGIIGNPDLQPEEAEVFEGALCLVSTRTFNLSANAFYNIIKNKVEFIYERGNLRAHNLGKLTSRGFEVELGWESGELGGFCNLSYQSTEMQDEDEDHDEMGLYPELICHVGVNYAIPRYHLNLNLQCSYAAERGASQANIVENAGESYQLDGYAIGTVTVSTEGLEVFGQRETLLSLKVHNVADKRYAEPGYNGIDIPSIGRRFLLRITQEF